MAFVIADRIKETSTTTGTGTLTLAGAVTGFRTFASVGNANTTTYLIVAVDANGVPTGEWETGIGTYTSSGTTLSRGFIASSTGSAVSFSAGTKHVICCDVAGYSTPLVMDTISSKAIVVANQTALGSTAGNARGKAAVDLQIARTSATRVASGNYATIAGGRYGTASGNSSSVGGGQNNNASGSRSTISGGWNNTASNYTATVCGGYDNTASGSSGSSVLGGNTNVASGANSSVLGGRYNTSSTNYAVSSGCRAKADKYAQLTHSAGLFAATGDAQTSLLVVRRSTTTATQSELFLNGSSLRMTIASDTTWAFDALVVARRTDGDNESAAYRIVGCIDNNAGATALVGSITVTVLGEDTAAWDVMAEADNTNDALVIKVTGEAAKTIRWVGYVRIVEVTG